MCISSGNGHLLRAPKHQALMNKKEHDQWLVDQYNRNRLVKDHIDRVQDIPYNATWLGELVEAYPNNMELGAKVRAKYLSDKGFEPKGKPQPEHDTWFDKNDRKQRG